MSEASRTYNKILEKKYRKTDRKKIWKKRVSTMVMIGALALAANTTSEVLKEHHTKTKLMHEATVEMIEMGYMPVPDANGNWDTSNHLLNEIDVIKIYALMGSDATEAVLQNRGFTGLEDYITQNGFENERQWRDVAIEDTLNKQVIK